MLRVPRGIRIVARGNGVLAADLPVPPPCAEFPAALTLEAVPGGVFCRALGLVQAPGAGGVVALVGPLAVVATVDRPISSFTHV